MKLAEALKINRSDSSAEKPFAVCLVCGFLPLHLVTFLEAYLRLRMPDRQAEVHTGLYGDLAGNIERLRNSTVESGAVVIEWNDLDPRLGLRSLGGWGVSVHNDILLNAQLQADRFASALMDLGPAKSVSVSLPTLPLPPISYQPSEQQSHFELRLTDIVSTFASTISENSHVVILNQQTLNMRSPLADRLDVKAEITSGFPYSLSHASVLGEMLAALVQPTPAKKGLITDLDDTVWRGLVGEVGAGAVSWSLDHESHLHALYQQTLNALGESGVLIAIASKNDLAPVHAALEREDLILRRDAVFPIEVNWQAKSESVDRILKEWNIGPDSVIFVDDSPMELEEVKLAFPEIETRLFPKGNNAGYMFLSSLRSAFGKPSLVAEDSLRTQSLRSRSGVEGAKISVDADGFHERLGAQLTFEISSAIHDERAFDLINKTNQFNLNGRRLSRAELQSMLAVHGAFLLTAVYDDKFGPLGKIAAILGQHDGTHIQIRTWVMSCRAFSRRIEHKILEYLFETFKIDETTFDFKPTDRNKPFQEFLTEVTGVELVEPFRLSRETFFAHKPLLTHTVRELAHA